MENITYELLKKSLDAAALRQRVIAHNIANINTKGFKRSDVVFEEKLLPFSYIQKRSGT
jgi:flagellar basal-body rod protein FlgB